MIVWLEPSLARVSAIGLGPGCPGPVALVKCAFHDFIMLIQETTFYYEMVSLSQLRPAKEVARPPALVRAGVVCPALSRFLYAAVGAKWRWTDRLGWSESQWRDALERPGHETWVAYEAGVPCGYFELDDADGDGDAVSIEYFGLLPEFYGRGLGGWLLTRCIERAWARSPERVVVHTSSLDHVAARQNYESRGFRFVRSTTQSKAVPDQPLNAWGVPAELPLNA